MTEAGKRHNDRIKRKIQKIKENDKKEKEKYTNKMFDAMYDEKHSAYDLFVMQFLESQRELRVAEEIDRLEKKLHNVEKDFNDDGSFTQKYKDWALKKAKEEDTYNLEFLERIQNKTYYGSNDPKNTKKRLEEYEKFLNSSDPNSYRPPLGDDE